MCVYRALSDLIVFDSVEIILICVMRVSQTRGIDLPLHENVNEFGILIRECKSQWCEIVSTSVKSSLLLERPIKLVFDAQISRIRKMIYFSLILDAGLLVPHLL